MIQAAAKTVHEPEDLLTLPDGDRYELVDGQLVEPNVSMLSSLVGGELHALVRNHCKAHNLGWYWHADGLFQCFPHRPKLVRKPDVAFVRRDRYSQAQLEEGICKLAPDLAAEVVSPKDLFDEIEERVEDYLRAGVRLVWVVCLKTKQVYVHRPDGRVTKVRENEELSGEEVLPGFRCRVGDLFPPPEDQAAANGVS